MAFNIWKKTSFDYCLKQTTSFNDGRYHLSRCYCCRFSNCYNVKYEKKGLVFHALRTRQSAQQRFIDFHVLTPGDWSVRKGHDVLEDIEKEIRGLIEKVTISTHLEPVEDPRSLDDISIERQ